MVFVADSQPMRMDANVESIHNLRKKLKEQGYDRDAIPYILQCNKRDMDNAASMDEMARALRLKDEPMFEAVATTGVGVFDTLQALATMVLSGLTKR